MWIQQPIYTSQFLQLLDCLPHLKLVNLGLEIQREKITAKKWKELTHDKTRRKEKLTHRDQNVDIVTDR